MLRLPRNNIQYKIYIYIFSQNIVEDMVCNIDVVSSSREDQEKWIDDVCVRLWALFSILVICPQASNE